MATVNIAAFFVKDNSGIQSANTPALLSENITSSATSAQSSVMPGGTEVVRITTDAVICVAFGTSPTAVTTDVRIPADSIEYFTVSPGQKVAVING